MLTEQEIKELKVVKYKVLNNTLFYTRYFFKNNYGRKFVVGKHHEIICEALDRVLCGKCKRLIINIAPRYGKTEVAVKNFISKGLGINPKSKYIHLTYSDDLALDNSESIRDMIQSEAYQLVFPDVQLKKESTAKNKWYTTKGGGVYARAAGGQVTGFGAGTVDEEEEDKLMEDAIKELDVLLGEQEGFGGAIIIDDPIKPEDATSDTKRERINQRFDSTIRNRVNSRNTPIIVIGQRVHELDLSGYLMEVEPDEWEVVSLPCLTYDENNQPQALWPFKHTVAELLKLQRTNELVFDTQYQQDASPRAGLLFPKGELHYYNPKKLDISKSTYCLLVVDPADTGGDYYSVPVIHIIENIPFVTEVQFNKRDTDENIPDTTSMALRNKAHYVQVEGNGGWVLAGKELRKQIQEKNENCEVRIIKATKNKETRILAAAAVIRNNFRFREDYEEVPQYKDFMKNVHRYLREGNNKNDDGPDALTQAAEYLQKHFPDMFT